MLLADLKHLRDLRKMVELRDWTQQAVVSANDRFLMKRRETGFGVECGRHKIPDMRGKLRLCLQAIDGISVADPEFKAATLIDAKAETLISLAVPAADHAL